MNASREFQRIVSLPAFFKPGLIAALLSSSLAAAFLLISLFTAAASVGLALHSAPADAPIGLTARLPATLAGQLPALQSGRSSLLLLLSLACLAFLLSRFLTAWSQGRCARGVDAVIQRQRQHLHRKAIRLEPADITGEQSHLLDRLFKDSAQQLGDRATAWAQIVCQRTPELIFAVTMAVCIGWQTAVQTMIPLILGRLLLRRQHQQARTSTHLLADQATRGLLRMTESLRKARLVSSFGMEQHEQQQFEQQLAAWRGKNEQLRTQQSLADLQQQFVLLVSIGIPFVILCLRLHAGLAPADGLLMALVLLITGIALRDLTRLPELASEGSERADEIAACIDRVPAVSQKPGATFLQPMSRTLTLNQVSFAPSQAAPLLQGLDLRVTFGERIALLSLAPEPALALASLIPRFIDPDPGQVLIDGRDIREGTLESLRAEALFVSGNEPLFDATALENISCGQPDITRQQAIDAAKLAHADNFIRTLPKGYETPLGEHGVSLDVGQRFRLSLARAAVREPAILIIEEPSIPLDAATKSMLDDAYQRLSANRTVIFLPTRLSTVKRCSRVVIIHDGKVAADGPHDQLLQKSELYRHWEYVRFNPFRVDENGDRG
ncbi:MAG: ATP-binding cassette domain-containing protein [Planctomycetota bacterium]